MLFSLLYSWKHSFRKAIDFSGVSFSCSLWKLCRHFWFALQSKTCLHGGLLWKHFLRRHLAGCVQWNSTWNPRTQHEHKNSSARKSLLHLESKRPAAQLCYLRHPGFPLSSRLPWSPEAVLKKNIIHPTWEKFPVVKSLLDYCLELWCKDLPCSHVHQLR